MESYLRRQKRASMVADLRLRAVGKKLMPIFIQSREPRRLIGLKVFLTKQQWKPSLSKS